MTAPAWFLHPSYHVIANWQESGENPVVFCYLIGLGIFCEFALPKIR